MVKKNGVKTTTENKVKLAETATEDFSVVELSTKKSSGKSKSTYVCNHTEVKNKVRNKPLSVVDDYAEFDFRSNRKAKDAAKLAERVEQVNQQPAFEDMKPILTAAELESCIQFVEEVFGLRDYEEAPKTAVKKKAAQPKAKAKAKVKSEPEELVVKEKNSEGTICLKVNTELERKPVLAEASDRICMDEAAERVVNTARMGALFDYYVQNY